MPLGCVWAVPVATEGLVAIVAKDSEAFREAFFFEPPRNVGTYLLSVLGSSAVDVVDGEEFHVGFSAAVARSSVMLEDFEPELTVPLFSGGSYLRGLGFSCFAVALDAVRVSAIWAGLQTVERFDLFYLLACAAAFIPWDVFGGTAFSSTGASAGRGFSL